MDRRAGDAGGLAVEFQAKPLPIMFIESAGNTPPEPAAIAWAPTLF